jgi:hypothetical protein
MVFCQIRGRYGVETGYLRTPSGGENLVIRWYTRTLSAATYVKVAVALAAVVALVVGAGADWRWD